MRKPTDSQTKSARLSQAVLARTVIMDHIFPRGEGERNYHVIFFYYARKMKLIFKLQHLIIMYNIGLSPPPWNKTLTTVQSILHIGWGGGEKSIGRQKVKIFLEAAAAPLLDTERLCYHFFTRKSLRWVERRRSLASPGAGKSLNII